MLRGPLSNPYLISGLALDILGYKWYTHQLNLITNYTTFLLEFLLWPLELSFLSVIFAIFLHVKDLGG